MREQRLRTHEWRKGEENSGQTDKTEQMQKKKQIKHKSLKTKKIYASW